MRFLKKVQAAGEHPFTPYKEKILLVWNEWIKGVENLTEECITTARNDLKVNDKVNYVISFDLALPGVKASRAAFSISLNHVFPHGVARVTSKHKAMCDKIALYAKKLGLDSMVKDNGNTYTCEIAFNRESALVEVHDITKTF